MLNFIIVRLSKFCVKRYFEKVVQPLRMDQSDKILGPKVALCEPSLQHCVGMLLGWVFTVIKMLLWTRNIQDVVCAHILYLSFRMINFLVFAPVLRHLFFSEPPKPIN